MTAPDATLAPVPATAGEYLGLSPQQRYDIVAQQFPDWLAAEPIEFPPHHPTYGWCCRVEGCDSVLHQTSPASQLCIDHARRYAKVKDSVTFDDFVATATPNGSQIFGRALVRGTACEVRDCTRELAARGYCRGHLNSLRRARTRGHSEAEWFVTQGPLPPAEPCAVDRCVHDKVTAAVLGGVKKPLCNSHGHYIWIWLRRPRTSEHEPSWEAFFNDPVVVASTSPPSARGLLSLAALPAGLQREIRYALHRHAQIAWRAQWRPAVLRTVVELLEAAGVGSLSDAEAAESAATGSKACRYVLAGLVFASRSLLFTAESAKAAGWFDPILVGAAPFPEGGGACRRKPWDLARVMQPWLRDVLWEHLRDEALKPDGKRPTAQTIHYRLSGVSLLSTALGQNRADHGDNPRALGRADAETVKQTWDLWFQEKIPLPTLSVSNQPRVLTEVTRMNLMSAIRIVLRTAREKSRTPAELDPFIFSLPEYPVPKKKPRPRPLTYGDFQLLVSPESLAKLDVLDLENAGLSDIWLTHAFQGGRIVETLSLGLGCIGIVGVAQPYIWRDIAKVGVVDYGMPCYLPVYERLLRRQESTRARLRHRYRDDLAALDDRGRARLEATWDREMPLFPRTNANYDLRLFVSSSAFRDQFNEWLDGLGLSSVTSHQTRATLATSLLNNGAPPALVRQLLGHFSEEALVHYANYNNDTMTRHLQQVWAASPGMDKPGTILLRPTDLTSDNPAAAAVRIDLTVVPVEHGLCRYGPVVGGAACPYGKNCSDGPKGPCEHFVLTGADLAYWERKRDAAVHFAEGAPTDEARDYILSQWEPWEPVLTGLRQALDELGLLEAAEKLDLRSPVHDYFNPLFSTGFRLPHLNSPGEHP
ncbi:tyrosine-type recombinase/integrase [Nocardia amamiensis]|uniref:tyrosine-type recombinase/integrase n=1 Tax=Nocardia amamiensis TaxID=404578 RepID=UPI00082A4DD4|nr:tyrosine-type recombinase/integrase [Nocardia amamiensis]